MLVYVVACGRQFDPWLRLIGASALAQHVVALFWGRQVGIGWLKQHYPVLWDRMAVHTGSRWLASGLARLQKVSA